MSVLSRLFMPPRPTVALEIAARHVSALRLRAGTPPSIDAHAVEPLAEGAVAPGLASSNILDPAAVSAALGRALARVGGTRHAALVVPDSVAKVTLVRFDQVPAKAADLDAMLRWNIRKSLPFKVDDAQVTYGDGVPIEGGGREFVVAAARRDLIAEYEGVCAATGVHAGVVDLATFNLMNLQLTSSAGGGDWLLVHLAVDYITIAIVRDGALIFYRHRGADGEEGLADLVHQTAMYYEDRLSGRGFGHVLVAGASNGPDGAAGAEGLRRSLEQRLGARIEAVDPRAVASFTDRISASPELLDQLSPLVGILVREPAA
jgi:Tfp pilus assembly PilM family ATPase